MGVDLYKRFLAFAHHDFGIFMAIVFFGIGLYNIVKDTHRTKKGFFDYGLAVVMMCFGIYILGLHFKFL